MSIVGVLTGMAEAHAEKQRTLFEREMDRRKQLSDLYMKFALDPSTRPEAMGPLLQASLSITAHPPDKKLPPKYEDITPFLTTTLPQGKQTISAQETPGFQPATPSGGGMPAVPPVPGFSGVGPLAPGQSQEDVPGVPALPSLPGPGAPAMPSVSLPPPPAPPTVQVSSRYTPEETSEMAAAAAEAKMAAEYPYKAALARVEHPLQPHEIGQYGLYIPGTGQTISPPAGVSLPVEQQMWNAAAISVAKSAKVPGVDWMRPVAGQLSPALQPAIAQEYERLKRLPPDESIVAMRKMMEEQKRQQIDDINARRGPVAVTDALETLKGDPDAWWDFDKELKPYVRAEARRQGVPVPTRKITTAGKDQEGSAEKTLAAITALDTLAKANPTLIGPVAGRLGEAEQAFGSGWRDVGEMQTAQEIRTRMQYLLGSEVKTLFGGRAAYQLTQMMEKVSANPKQNINLLMGSLTAMKWHAENVIRENMAYRFGGLHTEAGKAAADRIIPSATPPLAKVGETKQVLDPATGVTVTYRKGADGIWRRQK